jgi:micrococcal nuclease
MRKRRFLTILLFSIFLVLPGLLGAETWFSVRRVSDGDTLVLASGERVRYNGINAPEIAHEDLGMAAEPYGYAAKKLNIKLVKAKRIRLEFDVERRDHYGRLLAYVFLPEGVFVNAELVAGGYAYYLPGSVNKKYGKLLLESQRLAMSNRKGLWRDLMAHQQRYIGNRRSKRFHTRACPFGKKIRKRNRVSFANAWDAFWAGYAPAKRCLKISELFGQP